MMLAVVIRELIMVLRKPAVPAATCAIGATLSAFAIVWTPGVPVLAPLNLYEQTQLLHSVLLVIALPWLALRSMPDERADALVLTSAFIGLPPERIVIGRVIAMSGALLLVVLTGLPSLVLAQQSAAVPLLPVFGNLLPLGALAILTAVLATAAALVFSSSLSAWLACATVLSTVFISTPWRPGALRAGFAWALIASVCAGLVSYWSTATHRYLRTSDGR